MNRAVIVVLALLCGCTMKAGKPEPGQVVDCTDFRDGDKWTWHSENIDPVSVGIGTSTVVTGIADDGKRRSVDTANQMIKCERRP